MKRNLLIALAVVVLLVAFVAATGVIVWRLAKRTVTEQVLTPQERTIDLGTLVTQVRELHRLETASMDVMHVGEIRQSYRLVPNALAGDVITFLAAGEVIAGLDLAQLKESDVWRSPDGTINLRLPPPQILVTRVDNHKSRVIARKTGVLRRADVDLETRARQHAETNIRAEAIRKGILPLAQGNGEKKLAEFLHTLGFEKVRFVGTRIVAPQR
ncbi:MAG TPA: DUF4230 domain-containing protein [Thermoanaerobaculia bacterium]|nr:DUF4230 domain-containing protein [Thermoanaerobaculia bacterium]